MIFDQDFAATSEEIDWHQPYPYWEPFKTRTIAEGSGGDMREYPYSEPLVSSKDAQLPPPIPNLPFMNTDVQVVYSDYCTDVCVDDPSTPDEFECGEPEWCYTPIFVGRLTTQEYAALLLGTPIELAPEVNMFQELRYDKASDTVGLWEAFGGVDIDWNPDYRKSAEWSLYEIKKQIGPSLITEPLPIPTSQINKRMDVTKLNDRWAFYGFEENTHLVGRFTPAEWAQLQAGTAVVLGVAGEIDDLPADLQIMKAPGNRPGYVLFAEDWSFPLLIPLEQIAAENAPLSGGAVLSDAQLAELANGSRVYVDESLYYEYTPATDTLRLINEIDGSVVKQGTFETVLQVNKDGSAVSGGSGILLALGIVGIALSMSNRKSK